MVLRAQYIFLLPYSPMGGVYPYQKKGRGIYIYIFPVAYNIKERSPTSSGVPISFNVYSWPPYIYGALSFVLLRHRLEYLLYIYIWTFQVFAGQSNQTKVCVCMELSRLFC